MIKPGNFVVVLDSCVLFKANVRDLLLWMAKNELYQPRWSHKICEEVSRNLINRRGLSYEKAQRLIIEMNKHFYDAIVDDYPDLNIESIDPKDGHVVATAIASNAQVIVTDNLKHFPNEILRKYNLEAKSSDEFMLDLLDLSRDRVIQSFKKMEEKLINPPLTRDQILEGLMKQTPVFTEQLKKELEFGVKSTLY